MSLSNARVVLEMAIEELADEGGCARMAASAELRSSGVIKALNLSCSSCEDPSGRTG